MEKIIWLRLSYWIPAIADFAIAASVLVPERVGLTEFVYPMGLMSAAAFSWGILLIMADRKPVERRWILIPTIIIIFFLLTARVYAASKGLIGISYPTLIFGSSLILLLLYSYTTYSKADEAV